MLSATAGSDEEIDVSYYELLGVDKHDPMFEQTVHACAHAALANEDGMHSMNFCPCVAGMISHR